MACKKFIKKDVQKKNIIAVWNIYINIIKKIETKFKKIIKTFDWIKIVKLKKENIRILFIKH